MKRFTAALLSACLLIPAVASAGLSIYGRSKVGFKAVGPGGLKINGTSSDLSITEEEELFIFSVKMDTVTTGIGLRDRHMNEKYVQTEEYPTAELHVAKSDLEFPESGKKEGTAPATFHAHGKSQDTELRYTIKAISKGYKVDGEFDFNTTELGIEIPSYLGVTVDPAMTGHATFKLKDD